MKTRGVEGGTPILESSLCKTCRACHVMRGLAESDETVVCRNYNTPLLILRPIVSCSLYDDKSQPSRYDMEQIAWVLVTQRAGRNIGFVSPEERRKLEQQGTPFPSTPGF